MLSDGSRLLMLTNDDGVDAPGLGALGAAAEGLGELRVIAPSGPFSGCGHVVTTDRPIGVARRDGGVFAVDGTPADCVRLAMHHLAPEASWVLSGINAGGNLGTDVHHSGTVAAVREGVIHGRPGIAVSHYIARGGRSTGRGPRMDAEGARGAARPAVAAGHLLECQPTPSRPGGPRTGDGLLPARPLPAAAQTTASRRGWPAIPATTRGGPAGPRTTSTSASAARSPSPRAPGRPDGGFGMASGEWRGKSRHETKREEVGLSVPSTRHSPLPRKPLAHDGRWLS